MALSVLVQRQEPAPSSAYRVVWEFAAERQRIYETRLRDVAGPWTSDPILGTYRFTNCFRAADRVSQALIAEMRQWDGLDARDVFGRVFLFKIFNRIGTWSAIRDLVVESCFESSWARNLADRLDDLHRKSAIYSAAYIVPSPGKKGESKHRAHIQLLEKMFADGLPSKLVEAPTLQSVYELLRNYRTIGPFLGFQLAIDLNYSEIINFSEMSFVVCGPGAIDGLSKCFDDLGDYSPSDTVRWMTDRQELEFEKLGLRFGGLFGRPLHLIDTQNLLCEVSKYTRESHPEVAGVSGRTKIKQKFVPADQLPPPRFPTAWDLDAAVRSWLAQPGQ